jgi:hypothetical protein
MSASLGTNEIVREDPDPSDVILGSCGSLLVLFGGTTVQWHLLNLCPGARSDVKCSRKEGPGITFV